MACRPAARLGVPRRRIAAAVLLADAAALVLVLAGVAMAGLHLAGGAIAGVLAAAGLGGLAFAAGTGSPR